LFRLRFGEFMWHQGLWEGVSLATVVRECGKMDHVRRVNYWGFHNDDPAQQFRSSVSYTEAMEPGPADPPVMLCWSLNGQPLPIERGGESPSQSAVACGV